MSVDMLLFHEKVTPLTLYVSYDCYIRILQPRLFNFLFKENGLLICPWFVNATSVKSSSSHSSSSTTFWLLAHKLKPFFIISLLKAFPSTVDALFICLIFLFTPILIWDVKLEYPWFWIFLWINECRQFLTRRSNDNSGGFDRISCNFRSFMVGSFSWDQCF